MHTDYSKPLDDLRPERQARQQNEEDLCRSQKEVVVVLERCPPRRACVLCGHSMAGSEFLHRGVPFVRCGTCAHVQTRAQPPSGYPGRYGHHAAFGQIYPRLDPLAYEDRKRRIYKPKLDWAVRHLEALGHSPAQIRSMEWTELGCGAGYFLSCLRDYGVTRCRGIEADAQLLKTAADSVPGAVLTRYEGSLAKALSLYPSRVYVAFFVMEHLEDVHEFFQALRELPAGTTFLCAVPVFGFSALLESVFDDRYARNLDAVVHTQLFTDESVAYAMNLAGCETAAEWVFGQDAEDLRRFLTGPLRGLYPEELLAEVETRLAGLQNPFQEMLDRRKWSDQRHLLAVRK